KQAYIGYTLGGIGISSSTFSHNGFPTSDSTCAMDTETAAQTEFEDPMPLPELSTSDLTVADVCRSLTSGPTDCKCPNLSTGSLQSPNHCLWNGGGGPTAVHCRRAYDISAPTMNAGSRDILTGYNRCPPDSSCMLSEDWRVALLVWTNTPADNVNEGSWVNVSFDSFRTGVFEPDHDWTFVGLSRFASNLMNNSSPATQS